MFQNRYVELLDKNKFLRSFEEVKAFDDALAVLAQDLDVNILPDLFLIFEDKTQQPEVMWGLVHFIEDFSVEEELHAFIQSAPVLLESAQEWAITILTRCFDQANRFYLRNLLPTLPDVQKQAVISLLQQTANKSRNYKEMVDFILS